MSLFSLTSHSNTVEWLKRAFNAKEYDDHPYFYSVRSRDRVIGTLVEIHPITGTIRIVYPSDEIRHHFTPTSKWLSSFEEVRKLFDLLGVG